MSFTPTYFTGYEYGLATLSVNGDGICTIITGSAIGIQSTYKRSGSYALRVNPSSAASTYITHGLGASGNPIGVYSFYIYIHAYPSVSTEVWMTQVGSGNGARIYLSASTYQLGAGWTAGNYEGSALSLDTWYRVDVKVDCTNNPNTIDWKVNGAAMTQRSYAQAATYPTNEREGVITSCTADIIYDDVAYSRVGGDFPIGETVTLGLRPNAEGTHNNAANVMEDSSGNDIDGSTYQAYPKLDDNPWSGTYGTDYIRQATTGTGNYCEIQFEDTALSNIQGVIAYLEYLSAGTSSNQGGCIIRSNTTETTVWGNPTTRADYSESSAYYKRALVSPDGGSWDATKVSALRCRFGYSGDVTPNPYWVAIMLEYCRQISGTIYYGTPSGAISPSGALEKKTTKPLSGAISPSGGLAKLIARAVAGVINPSGILAKKTLRSLSGAITPSGALAGLKIVLKALSGAISPSGALAKHTSRPLTGAITPVGLLTKRLSRSLAGLISPSGALFKRISRLLSGAISPSGALSSIKTKLMSLAGSIAPSGALIKQANKSLAGAITPVGALLKLTIKQLQGGISPSGALVRSVSKLLSGAISPVGTLIRQTRKILAGALSAAGDIAYDLIHPVEAFAIKILRLAPRSLNLGLGIRDRLFTLPPAYLRKFTIKLGNRSVILRLPPRKRE